MIFYIFIYTLHFYGYITNSQSDQLPDGLIAPSVEHRSIYEKEKKTLTATSVRLTDNSHNTVPFSSSRICGVHSVVMPQVSYIYNPK